MSREAASSSDTVRTVMLRIPEELYEWLRTQAFLQRRSMNEMAIAALTDLRARSAAPEHEGTASETVEKTGPGA